jgi:F0F1-type ATP synthase assembly protein I
MTDTQTQDRVADATADIKAEVHDRLDDAKHAASDAARRTADAIEANPLAIVAGGIAIGALAGALIPRSAKEKQLLAPLGRSLGERARSAVAAAREAGATELQNAAAKDQVKSLFQGIAKAATTAGSAAAQSARAKD